MIGCKFNGGVNVIEISSEGLEVVKGVCPYNHEDVVYETPPFLRYPIVTVFIVTTFAD